MLEALSRQHVTAEAYLTHIVDLKEQIKLLRDRLFGRKAEQTVEPNTPQPALFNEPKSELMQIRVIKHIRKVYGCRDCETAPVNPHKPAQ